MSKIIRSDVNEEYAYAGIVEAGDFVYLSFCVGNVGDSFRDQVNGAIDNLEQRLQSVGLTLDAVVKIDVLLRDVWNIPFMEEVFKKRFVHGFPARKTISTEFAHIGGLSGLQIQIDAIAFRES